MADQQPSPSVRVIAFNAAMVGILRSVRIKSTAAGALDQGIKTCLQATAVQAAANPNRFATVMQVSGPLSVGMKSLIIVGFVAPN